MKTRFACLVCAAVLVASSASATLVVPMSLDALVSRADLIFEGTVVDIRPSWRETREGRMIMSDVTFRVARALKGDLPAQIVLDVFGGTIGKHTMRIAGMPAFERGDREVLFVRNGDTSGLPLVGLMQGRFRVARTALGQEIVTTFDGRAINGVADIGRSPSARAELVPEMSLQAFASEIARRVRSAANR